MLFAWCCTKPEKRLKNSQKKNHLVVVRPRHREKGLAISHNKYGVSARCACAGKISQTLVLDYDCLFLTWGPLNYVQGRGMGPGNNIGDPKSIETSDPASAATVKVCISTYF